MYQTSPEEIAFFEKQSAALPIYAALTERLFRLYPEAKRKVQKSQITFANRHVFACVSFARVRRKAELPDAYFVLTLSLPDPLESGRVAAKTEPYPGRWTTHLVIGSVEDLDAELFAWIQQAYAFAEQK